MSLAEWKEKIRAEGKFFVGQDAVPLTGTRLVIVMDRRKDLALEELAEGMTRAGIYARPLPKDDDRPNLYTFIGEAKGLEIASEDGPKLVGVTVDTIEEALAVDGVFVSRWELPSTFHPDKVAEIREAMANVDRERRANKQVFMGSTEVGPNRWFMLRVTARPGERPMRSEDVRDILLRAGYEAFTPDTGLLGFLVSSDDWSQGDWVELLFNPGNKRITVSDLYGLFSKEFVVDRSPVGLYDVPFLRDHQELFDFYFRAQQIEVKTTGGAGAIGETMTDLISDIGKVSKYVRYGLWAAAGVGVIWLAGKGVALMKESYQNVRN